MDKPYDPQLEDPDITDSFVGVSRRKADLTVDQAKKEMASEGYSPGEVANAFKTVYGEYAEAAFDSPNVLIKNLPKPGDLDKGATVTPAGVDPVKMIDELSLKYDDTMQEEARSLGVDLKSLSRYKAIPRGQEQNQQSYLDDKLEQEKQEEIKSYRNDYARMLKRKTNPETGWNYTDDEIESELETLKIPAYVFAEQTRVEKAGGYAPVKDIVPVYTKLIAGPKASSAALEILRSKDKRENTDEWRKSLEVAKRVREAARDAELKEGARSQTWKGIKKDHPWLYWTLGAAVTVDTQVTGIRNGLVYGALETIENWTGGKSSRAGEMDMKQLGFFLKQMEDTYKRSGREVPKELQKAVRQGKIKLAKFPGRTGLDDFSRGEEAYAKAQKLVEQDFKEIEKRTPDDASILGESVAIFRDTLYDIGENIYGTLLLGGQFFGAGDSPEVDQAYKSGDLPAYRKLRTEQVTKFYGDAVHTVFAAYGAMDSFDGFLRSLRNRPVSTFMQILPALRAIKAGAVAVPRGIRLKVAQQLDRFDAAMQDAVGAERYATIINAYDAAKMPVLAPGAFLKSFVVDRTAQLVPRASNLLRDIFNQPITTRAEDIARRRRIEPMAQEYFDWIEKQGPQSTWKESQLTEWRVKFDEIIGLFDEEDRQAVMKNLGVTLDSQGIAPVRVEGKIVEPGFVDKEQGAPIPGESLGQHLIRLQQERVPGDRPRVEVGPQDKAEIDFGGGPSRRLFPDAEDYVPPKKPTPVMDMGDLYDAFSGTFRARKDPVTVKSVADPDLGLFGPADPVFVQPVSKGGKGAALDVEENLSLYQIFEKRVDKKAAPRRTRRSDVKQAYDHVDDEVTRLLRNNDVEVPNNFVDAVMQIRPQELTFELLQGIAQRLPKNERGSQIFKSLVNTVNMYNSYVPLDPRLLSVLRYGKFGKAKIATLSKAGDTPLTAYAHRAVAETIRALDKHMRSKKLRPDALEQIKDGMVKRGKGADKIYKNQLRQERDKFNRAMKSFRKRHTWDRAKVPDSVNAILDEMMSARHTKPTRNAQKSKFLNDNAPTMSFVDWAAKYHPGRRYDEIPIDNSSKIPKDILDDPMKLDSHLTTRGNEPGLQQFFAQRGVTGQKHTSKYKEWVDMDWPEEQRLQLINYARWFDEGPRLSNGDLVAFQPVPGKPGLNRSTYMKRIYGPTFAPYTRPNIISMRKATPKPKPTTQAGVRAMAEEYDVLAKAVSPRHEGLLGQLRTRRSMSRQELTDLADVKRVESQMAELVNQDGGLQKASDLLAKEVEGAYTRKINNAGKERTQQELDLAIDLLEKGPDKLDLSMEQLPGALPVDPLVFLTEMRKKARTPEGRAWVAMAARRMLPSRGIQVLGKDIRMNRGYKKVPTKGSKDAISMGEKLGYTDDVYMPASAIRQWKWQDEALKAAFDKDGFVRSMIKYIKANLTAANLPTLLYNLSSNMGLQALTRGPGFIGTMFTSNLEYRAFLNGKKFSKDKHMMFEAIEESGALNTDFHRMELQHAAEGYPALMQGKKEKGLKAYLKEIVADPADALKGAATLRPLTKAYGGSDNLFKLDEIVHVINEVKPQLKLLKETTDYYSLPISQDKYIRFTVDKNKNLLADGVRLKSEKDLYKKLAIYGKAMADAKFFDYSDLPGGNALLKGKGADLLFSPFMTFTSKALWLPGIKRGLGRELIGQMSAKTNVPGLIIKSSRDRLDTMAVWSFALAQSRADFIEGGEDLKTALRYNPNSTGMLTLDLLRDPGTIWYKDMRSLDPLDTTFVITDIIEDMFGTRDHTIRAFGSEEGPQAIYYNNLGRERPDDQAAYLQGQWDIVQKDFPISGRSFGEFVEQVGLGRGPLLDLLYEFEAIGSSHWAHPEMTPKKGWRVAAPFIMPGTYTKIIDTYIGTDDFDSAFTSRKRPKAVTQKQVGETDEEFAQRKMTGFGLSSKPLLSTLDNFFKRMQIEWLARTVGTPSTDGSLKYKKAQLIEDTDIDADEKVRKLREIEQEIVSRQYLIKSDVNERKQRAYRTLNKVFAGNKMKTYGLKESK